MLIVALNLTLSFMSSISKNTFWNKSLLLLIKQIEIYLNKTCFNVSLNAHLDKICAFKKPPKFAIICWFLQNLKAVKMYQLFLKVQQRSEYRTSEYRKLCCREPFWGLEGSCYKRGLLPFPPDRVTPSLIFFLGMFIM